MADFDIFEHTDNFFAAYIKACIEEETEATALPDSLAARKLIERREDNTAPNTTGV